jgi:cellobiose phosphorylase
MYPYLTGSASWYLLTMLTEVFGVKGHLGDLVLEPKLVSEQFAVDGKASVRTLFAGRRLEITYRNPDRLAYGKYAVKEISVGGNTQTIQPGEPRVVLKRDIITACVTEAVCKVDVILGEGPVPVG